MSTIFMVMSCFDHGGCAPVKAYRKKLAAEAFAHRCSAPKFLELPPGFVIDTPENDSEWELYFAAVKEWESNHPAGADHCRADRFIVTELDLL